MIKDRNGKDLIEAKDIKKWQEYNEELYKKGLNNPNNHDGVVTHLELDVRECKVKWVLGNITTNKGSRSDGILAELFQVLKNDVLKCSSQYASKLEKLSSGHGTVKGQFSLLSQGRAMPENVPTIVQLHSFHMLARLCSKSFKLRFSIM